MTCNQCTFKVPLDRVGVALMEQHLLSEHGVRTNASEKLRQAEERAS